MWTINSFNHHLLGGKGLLGLEHVLCPLQLNKNVDPQELDWLECTFVALLEVLYNYIHLAVLQ